MEQPLLVLAAVPGIEPHIGGAAPPARVEAVRTTIALTNNRRPVAMLYELDGAGVDGVGGEMEAAPVVVRLVGEGELQPAQVVDHDAAGRGSSAPDTAAGKSKV